MPREGWRVGALRDCEHGFGWSHPQPFGVGVGAGHFQGCG